jgi:hypothetical protein
MTKFWVRSTIILSVMAKKKFIFSIGVVVGSRIRNGKKIRIRDKVL